MNRKQLKPAQRLAIGYYQAKINILHSISPKLGAQAALKLFTTPSGKRKRSEPDIMKHAQHLAMVFDATRVKGYRWQSREPSGKRLLIVHGYGSRIASFESIVGMGRRLGYEVFGFDAPAHGQSEGSRLNVVQYKNLLNHIIKEYGPFDAYVAHSLGGLSLILAMEAQPLSNKPKISLVCPATESSTAADLFFDFMRLPEGVRQSFEQEIERVGGVPIAWFSVSRSIQGIDASILWIHEKTDPVTPFRDVEPMIQLGLPNIEFYLTEGYAHNGIYRHQEVRDKIESFLNH